MSVCRDRVTPRVDSRDRADVLSTLYAAIARRRREFYAARPDLRRRLRRPVISVGNLAVGGRGKTPTVACLARELLAHGRAAGDPEPRLRAPAGRRRRGRRARRGRHPRGSRSVRRRAADAGAAAAGRLGPLVERSLSGRPPRRASPRRDGARPRRRVPAPAARSGHRSGDRRRRRSGAERADAARRPAARAARHAARGRRGPRRRRAGVRARPEPAPRAVRDLSHAPDDGAGEPIRGADRCGRAGGPVAGDGGHRRGRRSSSTDCARPGTTSFETRGVSRPPSLFAAATSTGWSATRARPGPPGPDDREGLRAPAAVPAVSDAGRVGAAYNGAGSAAGVPPLAGRRARRRPRPLARQPVD